MKNKLIVMFLTFIVLIVITPFIFGKFMNSKFNSMLLKLSQQNGIQIKEIKNKSSYLTTDRIFDVVVPGNAINQKEIKYIEFQTETRFKNLPVTDVEFINILKKIVLDNNSSIAFLKNKFKILVITPDFKVYKYRVFDNKINLQKANLVLSWKNFNGVYDNKTKIFKNENGILELKNPLNDLMVYNIKAFLQDSKNQKKEQLHFDVNFSSPKLKAWINNFNSNSTLKLSKESADIVTNTDIDKINVNNLFKLNKIDTAFEIKGIDRTIYEKLQNKKYSKQDINKLLKKGFIGKFALNIKDMFFMQDLGFLSLKSNFKIKNASLAQINNKNFNFLDLNLSLQTSPKFINIAGNFFKPLKQIAKIENNKAIIKIVINKGNISINGKEIKSY